MSIRELDSIEDLEAAVAVFDGIWHPGRGTQPISAELLKALSKAGNYVAGAYDGDAGSSSGRASGSSARRRTSRCTATSPACPRPGWGAASASR